jgi:hypothetical protein
MPSFKDMKSWRDRLGHSGLRSFTDSEGHLWVEQNAAKASELAKLARQGHEVAWEFEKPGGGYTGRIDRRRDLHRIGGDEKLPAAEGSGSCGHLHLRR